MESPEEREAFEKWLTVRSGETPDGEVYRLPAPVDDGIRELFRLTAADEKAEKKFRTCCIDNGKAIGFWNGRPILYDPLKPAHRVPRPDSLAGFLNLGWEQRHIDELAAATMKGNEIVSRIPAIAGRLLATPEFLRQRDALRAQWINIPGADRPGFPLWRSPHSSEPLPDTLPAPVNNPLVQFTRAFDAFCDGWEIGELVTWNHPLPLGPHWPALLAGEPRSATASTLLRTPTRFPLSRSDGVGEIHQSEHATQAAAEGIDDIDRWETYGRLLQIDHWDRVLTTRYADRKRPRNHVTRVNHILADHLDLDGERIAKLRKLLRALKSGRRQSLRGWR